LEDFGGSDEVGGGYIRLEAFQYVLRWLISSHLQFQDGVEVIISHSLHESLLLFVGNVRHLDGMQLLMSGDFETISLLHDKYTDLLRQYYYVGGMPEVVLKYVETDSLLEVRRIQSEILQDYDLDFSKHAPKEQVPRVRMVWNSIPSQLFKAQIY
jgi:hypothetical protein